METESHLTEKPFPLESNEPTDNIDGNVIWNEIRKMKRKLEEQDREIKRLKTKVTELTENLVFKDAKKFAINVVKEDVSDHLRQ